MVRIWLTEKGMRKREISIRTVKDYNKDVNELIDPNKLAVFNEVIEQITKLAEEKKFTINI